MPLSTLSFQDPLSLLVLLTCSMSPGPRGSSFSTPVPERSHRIPRAGADQVKAAAPLLKVSQVGDHSVIRDV